MKFSENLKKIREAMGLTQRELADKCGIKQPTISRYESGQEKPGQKNTSALLKGLGCTFEDLEAEDFKAGKESDPYSFIFDYERIKYSRRTRKKAIQIINELLLMNENELIKHPALKHQFMVISGVLLNRKMSPQEKEDRANLLRKNLITIRDTYKQMK